ncbi:hypothetical protein HOD38_05010 [archaeon]|jgi:hypothetical protein|nr:hypothetical protein [archaeon]MBT4397600.1 hypothetical protein [archaeon]
MPIDDFFDGAERCSVQLEPREMPEVPPYQDKRELHFELLPNTPHQRDLPREYFPLEYLEK